MSSWMQPQPPRRVGRTPDGEWIADEYRRCSVRVTRGLDMARVEVTGADHALLPLTPVSARRLASQLVAVANHIERGRP